MEREGEVQGFFTCLLQGRGARGVSCFLKLYLVQLWDEDNLRRRGSGGISSVKMAPLPLTSHLFFIFQVHSR